VVYVNIDKVRTVGILHLTAMPRWYTVLPHTLFALIAWRGINTSWASGVNTFKANTEIHTHNRDILSSRGPFDSA
jgi:hypothetical protein